MACRLYPRSVRQHSCGSHYQSRHLDRSSSNAFDEVLILLHSPVSAHSAPKTHLLGRENLAADHLSRDALSSFRHVVAHAKVEPTLLPEADGSSSVTASRLDISELERRVAFFFSHSLASSSQKTCRSEENQYMKFCSSAGAAPLPVTE